MNNTKIKYSLTATAVILGCLMATPGMSQDFSVPQPLNITSILPSMVNLTAIGTTNLKPANEIGPTNFAGSASVTLYVKNNSPYSISVSCAAGSLLQMYGYSSANTTPVLITNSNNAALICSGGTQTCKDTNVSISLFSVATGASGSGTYTPTAGSTPLDSANSTVAGTLFDASVEGSLSCTVNFLSASLATITSASYASIPVAYSS